MYNAHERIEHGEWLSELDRIADRLELDAEARSVGRDLFLIDVPERRRSKRAALAASIYAGSLVAGDGRSQGTVAEAASVSRLAVQRGWKDRLADAGLEPPRW